MTLIRTGWTIVAIVLVALRLQGTMDNRFQAFAHLVDGGFFGAYFARPSTMIVSDKASGGMKVWDSMKYYGIMGLAIALVELFAFLAGIGHVDGQ